MTDATLSLYVATRPILVAGRLRALFDRMGLEVLPPGAPPRLGAFAVAVLPHGAGAWVVTDHAEALPDELGRLLSQELRVPVTTVGRAGDVLALERAEEGRVARALALKGAEAIDGEWPEALAAARGGHAAVLAALGLDGAELGVASDVPRGVRFALLPKGGGKGTGEVIEIDPTLSCPTCGQAMRRLTGPHGAFYGCVRFPECKGRLSEKQAQAARAG